MPIRRFALACAALLLLAAAPHRPPSGVPVPMSAQPGTSLDQVARQLVAEDLAAARARGDRPLVLIGSARLGAGDRPALFVQLQSPKECGSSGCATAVYAYVKGAWTRVLDGASGPLAVASTRTRGMADLLASEERFVWTGSGYRSTRPAPQVDLRPRPPRH